jgi:hypothetical protein
MRRVIRVLPISFLLGCSTPNILLVHPRSGDMVECSSVGIGAGALIAGPYVDSCVKQYEAAGFIPAEKLTPEEKANITPGRFIRNRQTFIPSGGPSPLPNLGAPRPLGPDPNELIMRCGGRAVDFVTGRCM